MNRIILLDMDGVLVDFVGGALQVNGAERSTPEDIRGYDMPVILGIDPSLFWTNIDKNPTFWRELRPYPWAKDLVGALSRVGHIVFCSRPSANPHSASQKLEWIEHYFPHMKEQYILCRRKELLASPDPKGPILIDDSEDTVRTFRNNGGTAILFPQPWNFAMSDGGGGLIRIKDRVTDTLTLLAQALT